MLWTANTTTHFLVDTYLTSKRKMYLFIPFINDLSQAPHTNRIYEVDINLSPTGAVLISMGW